MPTLVLVIGSLYCLIPVVWVVIAASKGRGELFSTFTFAPGSGFLDNIKDLTAYRDGIYWQWMVNSLFYAGGGALLSAAVSAAGGYALGRFAFRGREFIFKLMLAGVLVPSIVLTVPQYFLLSKLGLADSYWSMLLPSILSPTASTSSGSTRPRPCPPNSSKPPAWTARASGGSSRGSRCR